MPKFKWFSEISRGYSSLFQALVQNSSDYGTEQKFSSYTDRERIQGGPLIYQHNWIQYRHSAVDELVFQIKREYDGVGDPK